jgi:hypothetical protein
VAQAAGVLLIVAGLIPAVHVFVQFVRAGGTPMPRAMTGRLVVSGFNRYVRNPIYLGVATILTGQALLLGQAGLLLYAVAVWVAAAAFVRWYEEPVLAARFGADYEACRRAVRPWRPRLHPWSPPIAMIITLPGPAPSARVRRMLRRHQRLFVVVTAALAALTACSGSGGTGGAGTGAASSAANPTPAGAGVQGLPTTSATPSVPTTATSSATTTPPTVAALPVPVPGNPSGHATVPTGAGAVDTSHPSRVVGNGTAASCTSAAVVAAVARGGVITFSCGPAPVTITLTQTLRIRNATGPVIVLDGGGLVTLSGGGTRRILYMNTCDQSLGWLTSHCQDQDRPQLTVQNLTFADGNSTGQTAEGGGGGAIFVRGGRFKVVNSRFVRNRCDAVGPDLGGAAVRVLSQSAGLPVYVVNSTFGGAPGQGGRCSNGGALSSIGVSWVILNSVFSDNSAIGTGANPARAGTPGGGSGGALYADGNRFTVRIAGSRIERNHAVEGGGAIFFVSNDHTGNLYLDTSTLTRNPSAGFETRGYPGIFYLGASHPLLTRSTLN